MVGCLRVDAGEAVCSVAGGYGWLVGVATTNQKPAFEARRHPPPTIPALGALCIFAGTHRTSPRIESIRVGIVLTGRKE